MIWEAIAAIAALGAFLASIAGAFYVSGKLTEKVSDHDERIKEHAAILEKHGDKLSEHDIELARLQAFNEGYSTAAKFLPLRES
jgi:uncharacterized protein YneF (UPF0154 family)